MIENWDTFPSPEDWDNEEYTGSLADTKVFTPSGGTENTVNNEADIPKPNDNAYLAVEDWNDAVQITSQKIGTVIVKINSTIFMIN